MRKKITYLESGKTLYSQHERCKIYRKEFIFFIFISTLNFENLSNISQLDIDPLLMIFPMRYHLSKIGKNGFFN